MLNRNHNDFGHLGVEKTHDVLKTNFWFPEMKTKVKAHIQNCIKCLAFSKGARKREGIMYSIPKENVPFITVHVDHFGPVDSTQASKKYVLLILDAFTSLYGCMR